MFKIVYDLPNDKSFAFVSRSGSSSMGLMSLKQFYPEKIAAYESDPNNLNTGLSHRLLGGRLVSKLPDGCAVMLRNPIERFGSLLNRTGYDIESALELVFWVYNAGEAPARNNRLIERSSLDAAYHFMPYSLMITENSRLFKFPDLKNMAVYLGIDENIACAHVNEISQPLLFNPNQLSKIQQAYAQDIEIWNDSHVDFAVA